MAVAVDWWSTHFTGAAITAVRSLFNEAHTNAEADFIVAQLGLPAGAALADVPCGDGRLATTIAARGFRVNGVDLSPELIAAARERGAALGASVVFEVGDMRALPWRRGELDGAFCFGNSFPYFDHAGNNAFLASVAGALKPGARFVCQTGLAAESILAVPLGRKWYPFGDIFMLHSATYDPSQSRLESQYVYVTPKGIERRAASYPIYRAAELVHMFETAGFTAVRMLGGLNEEPYGLGSPQLLLVATRA